MNPAGFKRIQKELLNGLMDPRSLYDIDELLSIHLEFVREAIKDGDINKFEEISKHIHDLMEYRAIIKISHSFDLPEVTI